MLSEHAWISNVIAKIFGFALWIMLPFPDPTINVQSIQEEEFTILESKAQAQIHKEYQLTVSPLQGTSLQRQTGLPEASQPL